MEQGDAAASRESEPGRRQDRRRLPPEMTVLLNRKQEHGLNHVTRRRILRVLHVAETPFSSSLLSHPQGALSDVALSTVAYHMKVLAECGMVREDHAKSNRGALEHFFVSEVACDLLVKSVLADTEELDAPKRDRGGE